MDQQTMQMLAKLANNPEQLEKFLGQIPEEDQEYLLKFVGDLEQETERDPLKKFKKNNPKQVEFLDFKKCFQFFIGGNKGGKTATITYKGVLIALGKYPGFSRKPLPGRPLICWLCGEDRNVLEQTPLEELTKWLRQDQYKIIKKGNIIDRVRIYADQDHEAFTDFIFKPYSSGVDIFESANVSGVVLCDEEIPEAIFRAMIPRMVAHGAWLMNALTPTHGITYTKEVIEGTGNYAGLQAEGLVDWVEVSTEENLENIDKKMYTAMLAAYTVYDDTGKPILNPDGTRKLTPEGEIRLRGKFESISGRVYPRFKRIYKGNNWHVFDSDEMPDLQECKIFAWLDYGRGDEFAFALVAVDKNDTHWVIDEIYQANMETHEQAEAVRNICDRWEVRPLMIVADCQIRDKKAVGGTILSDYQTCTYPATHATRGGQPILGYSFTEWRARYQDKQSIQTSRSDLGNLLEINDNTGKPSMRFNIQLCPRHIKCIENLQWKKTGGEKTAGRDDHGEAAARYYARAGITYNSYQTETELKKLANTHKKYRSTQSYKPVF